MNNNPLRKLARSLKYQNLYNMAREINGIQIFDNVKNFSKIQMEFLYWLSVYNRLYTAKTLKENEYICQEIIDDDFACDCYLVWESKNRNKKEDVNDKKAKEIPYSDGAVVFVKG